MDFYHCHIDLKQDTKALAFANAVDVWMSYLQGKGTIAGWTLSRRKLNLASGVTRDFMLVIEVTDLAQLDAAFRLSGEPDEETRAMYRAVHDLIAEVDFGLYRPFPDPERSDHMALL